MGRSAKGSAPPPSDTPFPDIIVHRDQVPSGGRGSHQSSDFGGKLGRYPLVGVDFENPFTGAGVDPGVPPWPLALPGAFDEAIGEAQGDLARAIATAVEHDDDLVGKPEAGQTIGELAFFIIGDDQSGKPQLIHAAALSTERQSRQAAASAASTDRPSIKVPVVRWSKPGPNIASGDSAEPTQAVRGPHGAYCAAGLGPNSPKVGVPAAAAMCISPVSLPMNIAQRRSTAAAVNRSTRPTRSMRRPAGNAARTGSACSYS